MSDSLDKIFTNAASGMSAQSIRMNTIASNLANSGSVGSSDEATYHAKYPIFTEVTRQVPGLNPQDQPVGGVRVTSIDHSKKPLDKRFEPNHPSANADGYVFVTNVNPIEEMTNMIAASKDYEANVDVMNTAKNMVLQSINVLNTK